MSILQAIILGIVQGLTEFLPVSSSGHLVIFEKLFQLEENQLAFNVAVHVGTLCSVLTVYRVQLLDLVSGFIESLKKRAVNDSFRLLFFVFLASIPTAAMGLGLRDLWHGFFENLSAVGFFLIITGFLLFSTRKSSGVQVDWKDSMDDISSLNWKKSLLIGFAQGFAIAPGISRSGTTIAVSLWLKIPRHLAAFFSFLLMIPAVLGASLLELTAVSWSSEALTSGLIGFASAYLAGVVGLKWILKAVKKGRLEVFSPYLWLLGAGLLLSSFL